MLKGGSIALRERVFGILHQQLFCFRWLNQHLIDVFPVGTMRNNLSGNRSGSGFVHFLNRDKEPLAPVSFFDCLNQFGFFRFHNNHLINESIIIFHGSQENQKENRNSSVIGGLF